MAKALWEALTLESETLPLQHVALGNNSDSKREDP